MSAVKEPAGVGIVETDQPRALRGNMGILELIFTVVAYNGPVVVFLGFIPAAILLGNGVGTPVTILLCGVVVTMVAVGLLKMTARLSRPGGFYALITSGLGRVPGLGAGFTALTCYFVALISVYALGGIAFDSMVQSLLNGPEVAWWVYALFMLVAASALGYFNISFSAKVLTAFLGCELVLMAAYDVSVLAQGGASGIGFDSFTWAQFNTGSVSIGFLFAIGLFGGFEATVIFRDEVKNPLRTIPAATYGVIALLAFMYAMTAWCFINAYGAAAIMDVVTNDLAGSASASVQDYTGQFAYDVATIMLFTSSFALVLAAHNITSRYMFNLAADGIFPKALGEAHVRHVSPHRASVVLSVVSLFTVVVLAVVGVDTATIYARLAGLYSYAFLMLLVFVSLAIGVYLLRGTDRAIGSAVSALVACVILAATLIFATINFDLLTGATGTGKTVLLVIIWGVSVIGAVVAVGLRSARPDVYARIGRQ
ncbi:APC family permease [Nocardioides sp. KIGAM211]|uniref:APC family permease n=1 Tax=Nocardioides luti TaxID=2761101 RepID=A0A7X0VB51_9ACTN|nr:APC family permease [Nocardioides luti]MBB6627597.1 APC family permease [Nocardioides luti]